MKRCGIRVVSGVAPMHLRQSLAGLRVYQTAGLLWSCPSSEVREEAMRLMRQCRCRKGEPVLVVRPAESLADEEELIRNSMLRREPGATSGDAALRSEHEAKALAMRLTTSARRAG